MTPEQLAFRQLGISGTDAAAICGVSSWRNEADVWLSKKHPGRVTPPSKAVLKRLEWGHRHEWSIAEAYVEQTGYGIFKPDPRTFRNGTVEWLLGSPDFLFEGKKKGLEAKKVSDWNKHQWGPSGTDEVPPEVLIQCTHYMLLCQHQEWDVAALIGDADFRIYTLHANRDLMARMLEWETKFYEKHIVGDAEPDFKGSEAVAEFLKHKYRKADKRIIEMTAYDKELKAAVEELRLARANKDLAEELQATAENVVKQHMADAAELHWKDEGVKITWKNNRDSTSVDWEEIAKKALEQSTLDPEGKQKLIAEFTSPVEGPRVFRVYEKDKTKELKKEK